MGSWTVVQRKQASASSGSSISATFDSDPAPGNAIVALVSLGGSSGCDSVTGGGITGNFNNPKSATQATPLGAHLFYGLNTSGGSGAKTVTANCPAGSIADAYLEIVELQWSGGDTSACVVEASTAGAQSTVHTYGGGGSGTAVSTGAISPTAGIAIAVFAITVRSGGGYSSGPSTGFTRAGHSGVHENAYQMVNSASGTYNCSWTMTNNYAAWVGVIFALKGVDPAPVQPIAKGEFF